MDEDPAHWHLNPASNRARRGTVVIAASVAAILVAGFIYLRGAPSHAPAVAGPTNFPTLTGPYAAAYDFVNPSLGWAIVVDYSNLATQFWIFKTTDGASRWRQQFVGVAEGARIYIHFFDDQNGIAYAGSLYRSLDGGDHWQAVQVPGNRPFATFASPLLGWVLEYGSGSVRILRTTDGGQTWTEQSTNLGADAVVNTILDTPSATFRDASEGWAGAGRTPVPGAYRTLDGGVFWQLIQLPTPGGGTPDLGYVTRVILVPGGDVLVMIEDVFGDGLGAFLSDDGGVTWQARTFPAPVTTADLTVVDANHWWVLRLGKVFSSSDAGRSWTEVPVSGLPQFWSYTSGRVIDRRNAWWALVSQASSSRTALALTSDGGAHWTMHNMPQPAGGNV
jgi:photosystem II stability/assembly factor-like uncharacterized protein